MSKNEESFLIKYLKHEGNMIRRFLTSKDLLIFLFFLIVSTGMWTLHALRKDYETLITLPITYEKAPKGVIEQADLPTKLLVTVTDNGTTLVRYRWMHTFSPIIIDLGKYTDGKFSLETSELERQIQKQLNNSTKIVKISPEKLDLDFEDVTKKEVFVVFSGTVTYAPQYMKKGEIDLKPSTVTVYGKKDELDSIKTISTQYVKLENVKGEERITIPLAGWDKVSFSKDSVTCIQRSERYTEKTIEVPIRPIIDENVQRGRKVIDRLRTFPLTAKVKFHIGLSNYDKIRAEDLVVTANSKDVTGSRIPLRLKVKGKENLIEAAEIIPANVDYVFEYKE